MHRSFSAFIALAGLALLCVIGCADKNSTEACQHETTMHLDAGNYDAVLQSACATPMQLGAAWFGKAGYDVTGVINYLIEANDTSSIRTDLDLYLNTLTSVITNSTFQSLDNSKAQYELIGPSSDLYKDAQFAIAIVEMLKTASLIKSVIAPAGVGTLTSCDINANLVPDDADAATCALLAGGSGNPVTGTCLVSGATATWTATADILFSGLTGTYRGLTVDIGTTTAFCPGSYKKLLYMNPDTNYYLASTAGTCQASDLAQWPCPVTSNIDFVTTFEDSLNSSISAISTALSSTTSDVEQAITDFRSQACGDADCTPAELANLIQSQL
jgi:hypothetical protein